MLRATQVIKAHAIWKSSAFDIYSGFDSSLSSLLALATHEDGKLLLLDCFSSCTDKNDQKELLTVQLCGRCPSSLEAATRALLDMFVTNGGGSPRQNNNNNNNHHHSLIVLEGIDLNLGCPQACAQSGGFGAFLVEQDPDLAVQCMAAMKRVLDDYDHEHSNYTSSSQPPRPKLSCKVRLLDKDEDTIAFCRRLEAAGCELLAIHCRRRDDPPDGRPDWSMGKKLVDSLSIPVVMNGGIQSREDIQSVLNATGAHKVMIAQGFLVNPYLLEQVIIDPAVIAAEYLEFVDQYPPPSSLFIARHFRWFFRSQLQPKTCRKEEFNSWRARLWTFLVRPYLQTVHQFRQVIVMYVYKNGSEMPHGLRHIPEPTFSNIRHCQS
jgi:tRNA-dihydrouridine synthase